MELSAATTKSLGIMVTWCEELIKQYTDIHYLWKNDTEFCYCRSNSLCTRNKSVASFQVLHGSPQLLDALGDLICTPNNLFCWRQETACACQTIMIWTWTAIQALCHHRSYHGTCTVLFIYTEFPFLSKQCKTILKKYHTVHVTLLQSKTTIYAFP
jgi:hypothetical protein